MEAQIRGLDTAVKNANDGMAMTKSIEGALQEVSSMLQRMRSLRFNLPTAQTPAGIGLL